MVDELASIVMAASRWDNKQLTSGIKQENQRNALILNIFAWF